MIIYYNTSKEKPNSYYHSNIEQAFCDKKWIVAKYNDCHDNNSIDVYIRTVSYRMKNHDNSDIDMYLKAKQLQNERTTATTKIFIRTKEQSIMKPNNTRKNKNIHMY